MEVWSEPFVRVGLRPFEILIDARLDCVRSAGIAAFHVPPGVIMLQHPDRPGQKLEMMPDADQAGTIVASRAALGADRLQSLPAG
jgi:hypothetical protein